MDGPFGSELFQGYEQDYENISKSLQAKITTHIPDQRGEERKSTIRAADREFEEAEEILGQMEMEILNMPHSTRTKLSANLRNYKADLEKLKRDLKRVVTYGTLSTDRNDLLGQDVRADLNVSSMDQRSRLLAGTDRLNAASRRLEESHRMALETEGIGQNILTDLRQQGEQLHHVRDTLHQADSHIDKASRTLKGMARRMATNKMITAAIIVVLVALILLVLYLKFSG